MYPDTELPDFHNFESWKLKEKLKREGKFKHGCCNAWILGSCKRGDSCKFAHIDLTDNPVDPTGENDKLEVGEDDGKSESTSKKAKIVREISADDHVKL